MNDMKEENPFTLTFGKPPASFITRYEDTNTIINSFSGNNPISQTYLIEGIRGSGKTVFMTSIANELKKTGDWVVADLLPQRDLLDESANRLSDIVRSHKQWIPSGMSLSLGGTKLEWKDRSLVQDNISITESLLNALVKRKKKVLFTIDEVSSGQNMRDFGNEFQILVRKEYPVFLIMTGLYEDIHSVQNDKSLTFLLRSPKIRLSGLSGFQITNQYESLLHLSPESAKELSELTKGYAFAFQLLGMLFFEKKASETLEDILPKLDEMLDDFAYRKIWESLSETDQRVVRIIPDEGIKTKEACELLSMTSSVFSKYQERLKKKGIMKSSTYGRVELTLPRFSKIVQRYP